MSSPPSRRNIEKVPPKYVGQPVRYQRHPPTHAITEKVPLVEKVFFCIRLEVMCVAYVRVEYQDNRLVATSKKFRLSMVGKEMGY
jgi:hypothetical protein